MMHDHVSGSAIPAFEPATGTGANAARFRYTGRPIEPAYCPVRAASASQASFQFHGGQTKKKIGHCAGVGIDNGGYLKLFPVNRRRQGGDSPPAPNN
jgi:methylaspartate ammonia-lyase